MTRSSVCNCRRTPTDDDEDDDGSTWVGSSDRYVQWQSWLVAPATFDGAFRVRVKANATDDGVNLEEFSDVVDVAAIDVQPSALEADRKIQNTHRIEIAWDGDRASNSLFRLVASFTDDDDETTWVVLDDGHLQFDHRAWRRTRTTSTPLASPRQLIISPSSILTTVKPWMPTRTLDWPCAGTGCRYAERRIRGSRAGSPAARRC